MGGPEYNALNVEACGCPSGFADASSNMHAANPGYAGCCTTDNMFAADGQEIYTEPNIAACGCPTGTTPSNSGSGCCTTSGSIFCDGQSGKYVADGDGSCSINTDECGS